MTKIYTKLQKGKSLLWLLIMLFNVSAWAQSAPSSPHTTRGLMYMDETKSYYNPEKAYQLLTLAVEQGDPKAMNGLAILYSKGLGVTEDKTQAVSWFEKAALAGYDKAWINWGNMVKDGEGTTQDFGKAFNIFQRGVERNAHGCHYALGYFYYKGLGCTQDYEKAVSNFRKAVNKSIGSMYMLGLCHRNGYGLAANNDSANYWLSKAAGYGYKQAIEELQKKEPENNLTASNTSGSKSNAKTQSTKPGTAPVQYKKEIQQTSSDDISGSYTGYALRYDWSGKKVISRSPLKLQLNRTGEIIAGTWTEGNASTGIQASLTDTALVFNNTSYKKTDHYHSAEAIELQFKDAQLRLIRDGDSVYLAGNVQLWRPAQNEPEKPMYISISKKSTNQILFSSGIDANGNKVSGTNLVAYPNPYSSKVSVSFTLLKPEMLSISLVNMAGTEVYNEKAKQVAAGVYTNTIDADIPTGAYVLKLAYGNETKTTVVVKQ